jgi:pimeloyl-ACP methyl ester carboxylesterase
MPYFDNDGIKIYYEIEGVGPPVVMIHGFSSNIETWKQDNCVKALKDNYQLILLDCRGHGKSDKPHDGSSYGSKMEDDVIKLMEYLSIEKANLFGYSMGAFITFRILLTKPKILISAILGGYVLNLLQDDKEKLKSIKGTKQIIQAFKADSMDQVKKPLGRAFRRVAELRENDLLALAAVQEGSLKEQSETMTTPIQMRASLKNIKVPVMTIVGSSEILSGDKTLIAQLVPDACHFQIQGKDHLTVKRDPKFHMAVKAFLDFVNYQH